MRAGAEVALAVACLAPFAALASGQGAQFYAVDINEEVKSLARGSSDVESLLNGGASGDLDSEDTFMFQPEYDELVVCPNDLWSSPVSNGTDFTLSLWIATNRRLGRMNVISKFCEGLEPDATAVDVDNWLSSPAVLRAGGSCDPDSTWSLSLVSSFPRFDMSVTTDEGRRQHVTVLGGRDLQLRHWQHLAVTFDSANRELKIYLNGQEDATRDVGGVPFLSAGSTAIGGLPATVSQSPNFLGGIISGLQARNASLSPDEIRELFQGYPTKEDSLVAWYMWTPGVGYENSALGNVCNRTSLMNAALASQGEGGAKGDMKQCTPVMDALRSLRSDVVRIETDPSLTQERELERESLLTLHTVYEQTNFIPIQADVVDEYIYVTAADTGIWRFKQDQGQPLGEVKDAQLVVPAVGCGSVDSGQCFAMSFNRTLDPAAFVLAYMEPRRSASSQAPAGPPMRSIQPYGIAAAPDGRVLFSDIAANILWAYDPKSGKTSHFAGSGAEGLTNGPLKDAEFSGPTSIATHGNRTYVADTRNHCIRVIQGGQVSVLAGAGVAGYSDGFNGSRVLFDAPIGLSLSEDGEELYVVDSGNRAVRKVLTADGATSSLAGDGTPGFSDGVGPLASFGTPVDLHVAPWNHSELYVLDAANQAMRVVDLGISYVHTPIQILTDAPDYVSSRKHNFRSHAWDEVSLGSALQCVGPISLPPCFGITADGTGGLLVSDTSGGALRVLSTTKKTVGEALEECRNAERKTTIIKGSIAAAVVAAGILALIGVGYWALRLNYRKKESKLKARESQFRKYMHQTLLSDQESLSDGDKVRPRSPLAAMAASTSPLVQVLHFLNAIVEGEFPSQEDALHVKKVLIIGALQNGDVRQPISLDTSLEATQSFRNQSLLGSYLPAAATKRRMKTKWQRARRVGQIARRISTWQNGRDGSSPTENSPAESLHSGGSPRDCVLQLCFDHYSVDLFELAEVTGGHPLAALGPFLAQTHGLFSALPISEEAFCRFCTKVDKGMNSDTVPYHTNVHVAGVLQAVNYLVVHGGLGSYIVDEYELLACMVAAIVHDYQHPGLSNDYLTSTGSDLALTYNDVAPLENFHVSSAFFLMAKHPSLDFMLATPPEDKAHVRKIVIALVMATSMSSHFEILQQGKLLLSNCDVFAARGASAGTSSRSLDGIHEAHSTESSAMSTGDVSSTTGICNSLGFPERLVVLRIAIKCADLYHTYRDFDQHERWCSLVMEEFYQQGDLERRAGLEPRGMFDRAGATPSAVASEQGAFLDVIVIPLFEVLAGLLPSTAFMLGKIRANRAQWADRMEKNGKKQ